MYNQVLNNSKYIDTMKQIDTTKFITDGKWDWDHGIGHAKRVSRYMKDILHQLGASDKEVEIGMTAALLHDVGLSQSQGHKTDHALLSSKLFRLYLEGTDVTKEEEQLIEGAIVDHSNGENITSTIGAVLVLADKLDITYHRTQYSSIQDEMNKEIQKIRKVEANINESQIIINYSTSEPINLAILSGWEKAFTIPIKIANYLKRDCVFTINGQKMHKILKILCICINFSYKINTQSVKIINKLKLMFG